MATYERADTETVDLVLERIETFYPQLYRAEVRVDVMMAFGRRRGGELVSAAIMHRGYPAAGTMRIIGLRDRAAGRGDAEMLIDGDHWAGMGLAARTALVDHELHHLMLVWEDEEREVPKADDCGRPRLKLRKHDFEIGGFHEIAKRHKAHAPEVRAVGKAFEGVEVAQLYLPGMGVAA